MDWIVLFALILTIATLIASVVLWQRVRALEQELEDKKQATDLPPDTHEALRFLYDKLMAAEQLAGEHTTTIKTIERALTKIPRHVGLARYNPFDDTGSNQTFTLALLDDERNGVVLTSLHSRQQTRVYAKALVEGKPQHPLTTEEEATIAQAFETKQK